MQHSSLEPRQRAVGVLHTSVHKKIALYGGMVATLTTHSTEVLGTRSLAAFDYIYVIIHI